MLTRMRTPGVVCAASCAHLIFQMGSDGRESGKTPARPPALSQYLTWYLACRSCLVMVSSLFVPDSEE